VLYILLYSVSKLVGRELGESNDFYEYINVFKKYPIYSHTTLIIFIVWISTLTHLFKSNPPNYFSDHLISNLWWYTILINIFIVVGYYLHNIISQSRGYWRINRHMNDQIMNIKVMIGLKKMLNIIWFTITIVFVLFITVIIY